MPPECLLPVLNTLRPNHALDAIDALDRLLQALEPPPLLEVALLQYGDALLELRARAPLRGHHLVGLAEELGRQLLELVVGAAEGRLGREAQPLLVGDFEPQRRGDGGRGVGLWRGLWL
jgi:hypothetical protein